MDQAAKVSITAMLNSFPQRQGNPDLLLRTFEEVLRSFDDKIIIDTAKRYTAGLIEKQSLTFAPSVAEFTAAARELVETRKARVLLLPREDEIPHEPITRKIDRVKRELAGRKILAENVEHKDFVRRLQKKEFPPTCEYVAITQTVYEGERYAQQQEAAE